MRSWVWIAFIIIVIILACIWWQKRPSVQAQKNTSIKNAVDLIKHNIRSYNTTNGSDCLIPYPVYYINMDKDKERNAFMVGQLNVIASTYQRVRGVEGFKLENTSHGVINGLEFINKYDALTAKELGCTLSHLLAIHTAFKANCQIALICEDDASFETCALTASLKDVVANAPHDWEMIELYVGGEKYTSEDQAQLQYSLFEASSPGWSNVAYFINRSGMEKLLRRVGFPIDNPPEKSNIVIDGYGPVVGETNSWPVIVAPDDSGFPAEGVADRYIPLLIRTYRVMPSVVGTNTGLGSTIHIDHVEPIHVPALYQFLKSVNNRILDLSPVKVHVVKNWDLEFIRHVLPFPITDDINEANVIVTNTNADKRLHAGKNAFVILIDREPVDVSDWKVDLIISTKLPSSGRLPKGVKSMYLPCYSSMFAEASVRPTDLLKNGARNKKTRFAAFVYSNCDEKFPGVEARRKFFELLQERSGGRVDSWGKCLRNMTRDDDKGSWIDNAKILEEYKFVVAFENDYPDGYISEKLVMPMIAGSIPIYLGSPLVGEHFDTKSFINVRDYDSWNKCIDRILALDKDDAEYYHMLDRPWLLQNRLGEHFAWYDNSLGNFNEKLLDEVRPGS
jgi:GR25 family glycosyltransferase involved in LPS biosynthesis